MSEHYVMNADGEVEATDMMTWARWFEKAGASRVIAKTPVGDVKVSTVFLGLDHSFGDGPPLIFETLVFGGPLDGEMERYSTRAQALAGHTAMVKRVTEHV
jgi:hypothetical protein